MTHLTRRTLLGTMLATLGATACSLSDERKPSTTRVPTNSYGWLFITPGSGKETKGEGLLVVTDESGQVLAEQEFTSGTQSAITTSSGGFAWLGHEQAWHWGESAQAWDVAALRTGHTEFVTNLDDDALFSVNGYGSSEGHRYGIVRVGAAGAEHWALDRHAREALPAGDVVLGFADEDLMAGTAVLTTLGPDTPREHFGPTIGNDNLWGSTIWHQQVAALTLNISGTAEFLLLDPSSGTVATVPLHGPGAETAQLWKVASNGPRHLTCIGDRLYWVAADALWHADPVTGETQLVTDLAPDLTWQLTSHGLFGTRYTDRGEQQRSWSLTHVDPTTGEPVRALAGVQPDGPAGLVLDSVAFLAS